MNISTTTICKICNEEIPILGMSHHVPKHIISYSDYIQRFLMEKCQYCGNPTRPPRVFCSMECSSKFSRGKDKNRTKRDYLSINEEEGRAMIEFYRIKPTTFKEVSERFGLTVDVLKKFFYRNKVLTYKPLDFVSLRYQEKLEKFINSTSLIQDYQQLGGSLHSLARKYGLQRSKIKEILVNRGVDIKSLKESVKESHEFRRQKGIHGHRFGKTPPAGSGKAHWFLYEGVKYQGSWEFKLGLWLKNNGISFLCHKGVKSFSYTLNNTVKTYCPDFYIPREDYYIDVKGYFSDSDRMKMDEVRKTYPHARFEIYDKKRLSEIGAFTIDKKLNIRLEDYVLDYKNGDIIVDKFLSSVSPQQLGRKKLIERKSLLTLSHEYGIPYFLMCRAYYKVVPKEKSREFFQFIADNFMDISQVLNQCAQSSAYTVAKEIKNGLNWKRNFEVVKRIKEGRIIPCL